MGSRLSSILRPRSGVVPLAASALALLAACDSEVLDTTRKVDPSARGTLGQEIYGLFHRDFEREDPRKADGFALERDGFVGAIDHLFPRYEGCESSRDCGYQYVQDFLVKLLPLQDDGTLPGATEKLAGVVERMVDDPDVVRSTAQLLQRIGYVDLEHETALVRRMARYPEFHTVAKQLLRLALEHDGLDADGQADANEPDELARLLRTMSQRMTEMEISADDQRGIVLAADFMLREDARLAGSANGSFPAMIVLRDARGVAKVSSSGGQLMGPFADVSPADGLPDLDLAGRFISASGTPIDLPPFGAQIAAGDQRDSNGRLVTPNGDPVYAYVDLDRTILAGVLRDSRELIHEGIPMKAVRTIDRVLGERLPDEGTYAADNGLLDLMHAIGAAGDMAELPEALGLIRKLLEEHEATTMWAELEVEAQLDIADRYDVSLKPGNTFFEDLMSTVRKILREPGLAEDLLVAFRDPAVAGLPAAFDTLMSHKKALITPADVASHSVYVTPVDRAQADVPGNQSLQQRLFHLIYDTKGVRYEPHLVGIPLGFIFTIDDLAEFYMLSIIGQAQIPSLVSTLTGLSERPTPDELAAFINADQTFGNPQGHEGLDVKDNDGDTLFAATSSGMTDALRPLIQVFYDHGQMRLLFELFEDLHLHWASTASDYQDMDSSGARWSHLSGIARYEPMLIDQFRNTKVIDSARKLLDETASVRTSRGRLAHDMLLILARKLIDKDTSLRARDGRREVTFDGQRITPLSPFDLIRYARARLKAVVRRTAEGQAEWDDVVDAVHRIFLKTERTGPESGRLQNPRALPVASALLSFLEDRATYHASARDLSPWITVDVPKHVEDALTSKELPAIVDLLYAIDADQELSSAMAGLRDELMDEDKGFQDLLVTAGDLLQTAKDAETLVPFAHFLGRELHPDDLLLFTFGRMTDKAIKIDTDEHMLEVMRRALDYPDAAPGEELRIYASGLVRAVRQLHRVNPLDEGTPDADDVEKIMTKVGQYLTDDQHGLEKFYDVVKKRKVGSYDVE